MTSLLHRAVLLIAVALILSACQTMGASRNADSDRSGMARAHSHQNDDLNIAKRHFRENNYGLAERHYRRAVESQPSNAEAWVGLGASYDQLRRFDLADRAYDQAMSIIGPTPELLNNRGYSYLLRGEHDKARRALLDAQAKDPDNPFVNNNLALLEAT